MQNISDIYMIIGKMDGTFSGFNWTGTKWSSYPNLVSGLTDIGDNSKPALFYNGNWHMIAGKKDGTFSAFSLTESGWVPNSTLENGLTDIGDNSAPSAFYATGTLYLIAGNSTGDFTGFKWTGTKWQPDNKIVDGLSNVGSYSSPAVFYKDDVLYMITGNGNGGFVGFNLTDKWRYDSEITKGLSVSGSYSSPAAFLIDKSYNKVFKYRTSFFINGMEEYPSPGSDCYQNKTTISIPEGHACLVNISANSTHGWGVKLKITTTPGKTLAQDPFNVCGYIGNDLYGFCQPLGFGHTTPCPVYKETLLRGGDYEFGIVSSTGVRNGEVSKACAYIEKCSDCRNPYAQYYCDLCAEDICKDNIRDCGETGIDCGGPCEKGRETDGSYVPSIEFEEPSGLSGTILLSADKGLNCVDGIDNDHDCLIDCADPDCSDSIICTLTEPPVVEVEGMPKEPCKSEIEANRHPAAREGKWDMNKQIDCSAYPEIKCTTSLPGYNCNLNSYRYIVYDHNPGQCPGQGLADTDQNKLANEIKYQYDAELPEITDTSWVCAYAEDLAGNANVSVPVKFDINKTFEFDISAYVRDDKGNILPGTKVDAFLCKGNVQYCNNDAPYLEKFSAISEEDGKVSLKIVRKIERGETYKIGLQTEKGYAEAEFTA